MRKKDIEEREERNRLKFVVSQSYLQKVKKLREYYEKNKALYQMMMLTSGEPPPLREEDYE